MDPGDLAEPPHNTIRAASQSLLDPSGRELDNNICSTVNNLIDANNSNATTQRITRRRSIHWRRAGPRQHWQREIPFRPLFDQHHSQGISHTKDFGDGVGDKPADVFWVAYGNINGFLAVTHSNPKAHERRHWLRCVDVDFFAGNEGKINWACMPHSGCLPESFWSKNDLRTVAAFNSNENFALKHFGGTFQLTMGQLAARVHDTGVDKQHLSRWA
jgi:hypothetical protein